MAKFKCIKCGKEQTIVSHICKLTPNGDFEYFYPKGNKKIKCEDCGSDVKFVNINEEENFSTNIGKFSSLSYSEKQAALKKRSREDAKKQKYRENYKEAEYYEK